MRTLYSTLTISIVLFSLGCSAVVAENKKTTPAGNAALGVLMNSSTDGRKCGNPADQWINRPMPVVPGKFLTAGRVIFPVVTVSGGNTDDQESAMGALLAALSVYAGSDNSNFTVAPTNEPIPAGVLVMTFKARKIVDQTENTQSSENSESSTENSRRNGSYGHSDSNNFTFSVQTTSVMGSISGNVTKPGMQLAALSNCIGESAKTTARNSRESWASAFGSSTRRYGSSNYAESGSRSDTYRSSSSAAEAIGTVIVLENKLPEAVAVLLSIAIDTDNLDALKKGQISLPIEEAPAPTVTTSSQPIAPVMIYTGATDYNLEQ